MKKTDTLDTHQATRAEVLARTRALSVDEGYLMESCKLFSTGTPIENAIAFIAHFNKLDTTALPYSISS